MSTPITAEAHADRRSWMVEHRIRYIESGGADGHVENLEHVGGRQLGTNLLLRYRGRKSGKTFVTPLCYGIVAGEVVIVGSKGGIDVHPEWYLNIKAAGTVEFQIATQAFSGSMREPVSDEAERIWAVMIDNYPFYGTYRANTPRAIPLVLMTAAQPIPVFTWSDISGERQSF